MSSSQQKDIEPKEGLSLVNLWRKRLENVPAFAAVYIVASILLFAFIFWNQTPNKFKNWLDNFIHSFVRSHSTSDVSALCYLTNGVHEGLIETLETPMAVGAACQHDGFEGVVVGRTTSKTCYFTHGDRAENGNEAPILPDSQPIGGPCQDERGSMGSSGIVVPPRESGKICYFASAEGEKSTLNVSAKIGSACNDPTLGLGVVLPLDDPE